MPNPQYSDDINPHKISHSQPVKLKSTIGAIIPQFIFIKGMSFRMRNHGIDIF